MTFYKNLFELLIMSNFLYFVTSVFGFYFLLQLAMFIWLWCKHDLPIKRIHEQLLDIPTEINESNRGRGVTTSVQEKQIEIKERPLKIELKRREFRRQLFLDRAHLISLLKIK